MGCSSQPDTPLQNSLPPLSPKQEQIIRIYEQDNIGETCDHVETTLAVKTKIVGQIEAQFNKVLATQTQINKSYFESPVGPNLAVFPDSSQDPNSVHIIGWRQIQQRLEVLKHSVNLSEWIRLVNDLEWLIAQDYRRIVIQDHPYVDVSVLISLTKMLPKIKTCLSNAKCILPDWEQDEIDTLSSSPHYRSILNSLTQKSANFDVLSMLIEAMQKHVHINGKWRRPDLTFNEDKSLNVALYFSESSKVTRSWVEGLIPKDSRIQITWVDQPERADVEITRNGQSWTWIEAQRKPSVISLPRFVDSEAFLDRLGYVLGLPDSQSLRWNSQDCSYLRQNYNAHDWKRLIYIYSKI